MSIRLTVNQLEEFETYLRENAHAAPWGKSYIGARMMLVGTADWADSYPEDARDAYDDFTKASAVDPVKVLQQIRREVGALLGDREIDLKGEDIGL